MGIFKHLPADWIAVTVQQLRACVRARQTTTALGEESASRGYSCRASGVINLSIPGDTAFKVKGFHGWLIKKHMHGAS